MHMSPTFNESSAIRLFEHANSIIIRLFDFYPGLPHMVGYKNCYHLWSSEAEEVARVKPETLLRLNESTSRGDGWYAFRDCDNKCRLATG